MKRRLTLPWEYTQLLFLDESARLDDRKLFALACAIQAEPCFATALARHERPPISAVKRHGIARAGFRPRLRTTSKDWTD